MLRENKIDVYGFVSQMRTQRPEMVQTEVRVCGVKQQQQQQRTCVCACIHTCVYVCVCVRVRTYAYIHTCMCVRTYVGVCMCDYVCACVCVYDRVCGWRTYKLEYLVIKTTDIFSSRLFIPHTRACRLAAPRWATSVAQRKARALPHTSAAIHMPEVTHINIYLFTAATIHLHLPSVAGEPPVRRHRSGSWWGQHHDWRAEQEDAGKHHRDRARVQGSSSSTLI